MCRGPIYKEGLYEAPLYERLYYEALQTLQSSYREGLPEAPRIEVEFLYILGENMPPKAFALVQLYIFTCLYSTAEDQQYL